MIWHSKSYLYTISIETIAIIYETLCFFSDNIALGKPATQLGTFKDNVAGRAVDGNTRQNLSDGSCAHPYSFDHTLPAAVSRNPAWWSVDLSAGDPSTTYVITNVTIYFRHVKFFARRSHFLTKTFKMHQM